jgi:nitrogen fixation/metabolism regulation signal transduction histidine kinase
LAIVKKIVDEHAGRVTIENVAPHGGKVTLHFHARKAAVQRASEEQET